MTTVDLKVHLSNAILEHLQQEATKRRVSLDVVVTEVLADYFDEPTEDDIANSLRTGMQQALAGNYRRAQDVLDEIDCEMTDRVDRLLHRLGQEAILKDILGNDMGEES